MHREGSIEGALGSINESSRSFKSNITEATDEDSELTASRPTMGDGQPHHPQQPYGYSLACFSPLPSRRDFFVMNTATPRRAMKREERKKQQAKEQEGWFSDDCLDELDGTEFLANDETNVFRRSDGSFKVIESDDEGNVVAEDSQQEQPEVSRGDEASSPSGEAPATTLPQSPQAEQDKTIKFIAPATPSIEPVAQQLATKPTRHHPRSMSTSEIDSVKHSFMSDNSSNGPSEAASKSSKKKSRKEKKSKREKKHRKDKKSSRRKSESDVALHEDLDEDSNPRSQGRDSPSVASDKSLEHLVSDLHGFVQNLNDTLKSKGAGEVEIVIKQKSNSGAPSRRRSFSGKDASAPRGRRSSSCAPSTTRGRRRSQSRKRSKSRKGRSGSNVSRRRQRQRSTSRPRSSSVSRHQGSQSSLPLEQLDQPVARNYQQRSPMPSSQPRMHATAQPEYSASTQRALFGGDDSGSVASIRSVRSRPTMRSTSFSPGEARLTRSMSQSHVGLIRAPMISPAKSVQHVPRMRMSRSVSPNPDSAPRYSAPSPHTMRPMQRRLSGSSAISWMSGDLGEFDEELRADMEVIRSHAHHSGLQDLNESVESLGKEFHVSTSRRRSGPRRNSQSDEWDTRSLPAVARQAMDQSFSSMEDLESIAGGSVFTEMGNTRLINNIGQVTEYTMVSTAGGNKPHLEAAQTNQLADGVNAKKQEGTKRRGLFKRGFSIANFGRATRRASMEAKAAHAEPQSHLESNPRLQQASAETVKSQRGGTSHHNPNFALMASGMPHPAEMHEPKASYYGEPSAGSMRRERGLARSNSVPMNMEDHFAIDPNSLLEDFTFASASTYEVDRPIADKKKGGYRHRDMDGLQRMQIS